MFKAFALFAIILALGAIGFRHAAPAFNLEAIDSNGDAWRLDSGLTESDCNMFGRGLMRNEALPYVAISCEES